MTHRVPRSAGFWRKCVFGSALLLAIVPGMAQSKRAIESYEKGQKALADRNLAEAGKYYAKAIEQNASYAEAYIKMGELAVFDRNMDAAAKYYEKAVSLKPMRRRFSRHIAGSAIITCAPANTKKQPRFSKNSSPFRPE